VADLCSCGTIRALGGVTDRVSEVVNRLRLQLRSRGSQGAVTRLGSAPSWLHVSPLTLSINNYQHTRRQMWRAVPVWSWPVNEQNMHNYQSAWNPGRNARENWSPECRTTRPGGLTWCQQDHNAAGST
jgi:hypothetical protein